MKLSLNALGLVIALAVSGCMNTTDTIEQAELLPNEPNVVDPDDSFETEGVLEVVHPVEPIEITLTESPEASNQPIENLWEYAAQGFSFEITDNPRLQSQLRWYLRHPSYMKRVSKRATPFLYHIVQRIEARQMPMELVLLPIVESGFDPFAYSHGSAAGMWQFIEGTGKRFGLKQTWWYDGRRDVIASTDAALDYLTYLHKFFDGNWMHALAAYNSGEGRVRNAIRKNERAGKPTDFWSLELPRETRAYVPKLLALAEILKNQDKYDFEWPTIDNAPVIEVVEIDGQIDLAIAAKWAGLTLQELSALNAGFNRWATDPDGPHQLVLPLDKAESFTLAMQNADPSDRVNWTRHKIRSGDSLLKIAKQYHTTVDVIKQINGLSHNMIRAGKYLLVPNAVKSLDEYVLSNEQRLASLQSRKRSGHQIKHTVVSGDTLWDLSRKYDVSSSRIAKWNGMAPGDMLMPGKTLVIWLEDGNQNLTNVTRKVTYTVRRGDSLSRIADKFKVRVSELRKWNQLQNKKYLQPGQKLTVIVDVVEVAS